MKKIIFIATLAVFGFNLSNA